MDILEAYRLMALIRALEERTMRIKVAGKIPGSVHLCNGQEAIPVGACAALGSKDAVTTTYRGHGWAIAREVPPVEIFAEMLGQESALCGGRAGSPQFSSSSHGLLGENSIVAGGLPIALGAALAASQLRDGTVSLVSVGDGALNQGAAHESLNMAAALALPLVVVVENNRYSEMTPIQAMVKVKHLSERAGAYGMPGTTVDGNDPEAVEGAVGAAVRLARGGGGPSLVEALTERLVGHHTADGQRYRPPGEIEEAKAHEPLVRLRGRLEQAGLARRVTEMEAEVEALIERALREAEARAPASPATVMEHVYA